MIGPKALPTIRVPNRCRGVVGAHGGAVEALPGPGGRGTTLRITKICFSSSRDSAQSAMSHERPNTRDLY
jgi:hypothetical protein